jgi:hypothetical protein
MRCFFTSIFARTADRDCSENAFLNRDDAGMECWPDQCLALEQERKINACHGVAD